MITTYGVKFVASLISLSSPDALRLAEMILNEAPWDRDDRANLLSGLYWKRAALCCEAGDPDAAMSSLEQIRGLLIPLEDAGAAEPLDEASYFTRLISEQHTPSEDWKLALEYLEARELAPLREREDFQALLREFKAHF